MQLSQGKWSKEVGHAPWCGHGQHSQLSQQGFDVSFPHQYRRPRKILQCKRKSTQICSDQRSLLHILLRCSELLRILIQSSRAILGIKRILEAARGRIWIFYCLVQSCICAHCVNRLLYSKLKLNVFTMKYIVLCLYTMHKHCSCSRYASACPVGNFYRISIRVDEAGAGFQCTGKVPLRKPSGRSLSCVAQVNKTPWNCEAEISVWHWGTVNASAKSILERWLLFGLCFCGKGTMY